MAVPAGRAPAPDSRAICRHRSASRRANPERQAWPASLPAATDETSRSPSTAASPPATASGWAKVLLKSFEAFRFSQYVRQTTLRSHPAAGSPVGRKGRPSDHPPADRAVILLQGNHSLCRFESKPTVVLVRSADCQFGDLRGGSWNGSWSCSILPDRACVFQVPVAQLDRSLASEARGCRFESCRGYLLSG